ncbi:calcium-binding protein 2 [Chrysochromulina tobinii]|uniref:Calcium-binding protein 2 n=1 Tax=Chrysochromulina tobinii TaxID=1460289 RepID=A0A0M0J649_9EUKA|nr:calcium-binding protein 2 [Chrysochromulina tobinii]|eukprot:KOO22066.1 calcium-binding protein 2 [Chrysochromulina sp. CCMP291]
MKAIVEQEKIRYAQHKKLRDLLSKKIGTVCSFFEVIDKDHNGQVSRSEFHEGMEALGLQDPGFNMPPHIYDELFDEFDMDGSGEISYKEYFQYVLRDSIRRKANLFRDFFIRSDVSGDGQIDKAEFRAAVMLLHGQHGHEMEIAAHVADVDEVFDDMDVNGSGSLTLNELHRQLRCSVGMGKFVRAKAKRDGSVVQRKTSNAKLRGSLRDQFLFHNPNKDYFGHSLEHVEKYVERTAVAQAAYSLAVDTRLDKHLDSGDRDSACRGHTP